MKKCAVINDLSGFGKCSLTASIPIMSAMGVEVHPLLTAVLSNQTAYDSFKSVSLTHTMRPFIEEWKKLGAKFDEAHGATLSAVWGSWARYVYHLDEAA